jgi:thiamine-phosphate pyrophosphorylase
VAPLICLITDRARTDPVPAIRSAAHAGVDLVQIRERDLADRALLALTRAALDAISGTSARLVVNERVDVALAAGAHGVHLRADSVAASRIRAITPPGFLIGRSVHEVDEAVDVDREGAVDYVIFGTVFSSASKPAGHSTAGLDALARVCAAVTIPVLAIGGIDPTRAVKALHAGATGVAAIGWFARSDAAAAVRQLRRAIDTRSEVV